MGSVGNTGAYSTVNIGLQDLMYNNVMGSHDISVGAIANDGMRGVVNVGKQSINNVHGSNNIHVGALTQHGNYATTNIAQGQTANTFGKQNTDVDSVGNY